MQLNLFETQTARHDVYEATTSKIATRVFIALTCLFVLILTIYTAASLRTQTIIIPDPTEMMFENLYSQYSSTLECPCTRITTAYENFVALSPEYHSVCSSQYVTSAWIASTSSLNWVEDFFDVRDFRVNGQVFFSAIATLCNLIKLTVANAWFIYKQSSFITEQVLAKEQAKLRVDDALIQFESDTTAEFKRALAIIQFQTTTLLVMGSQNYAFNLQELSNWFLQLISRYSLA